MAAGNLYLNSADASIYNRNLVNQRIYWRTILSLDRTPFANGQVIAKGPFHIDTNHREAALLVGPLALRTSGKESEGGVVTSLPSPNLTDATVRLRVKLDYEPAEGEHDVRKGGQLVFWFQAALPRAVAGGDFQMPQRFANYVFNRNLLADAQAGIPIEIPIRPDLNQWTCLGQNPIDTRAVIGSAAKYSCALNQIEFANAVAKPESMGVLFLLPVRDDWLDGPEQAPMSTHVMKEATFALSEFVIVRPATPSK